MKASAFARIAIVGLLLIAGGSFPAPAAPDAGNLALLARASASESQASLTPEKAVDGDASTRWSGIPGHNSGVWFQLDWERPVPVSEVVVRQYGAYVMEMDLQVWDAARSDWRTLRHLGKPGERLPRVVVVSFPTERTTRLRLSAITNGPSFDELEVFETPRPHRLSLHLASDLRGRIIGMVTDQWGSEPVAGAKIRFSGRGGAGAWRTEASSDGKGLLFVPMPLGLEGPIEAEVLSAGTSARALPPVLRIDARDLQYGLTPRGRAAAAVELDGTWRFKTDPPDGFWRPDFDDQDWSDIPVPSHWEMQGFRSTAGIGGYRKAFECPPGAGRLKLRFEGVYSGAEVWLNGVRAAYHEGGATPFEADVTAAVRPGRNLLAVRVREHTRVSDDLDKMSLYADFPLAGIIRRAYLFRVPDAHVGALEVTPRFDASYQDGTLDGRAAILNESGLPLDGASLAFRLTGLDGRPVPHESKAVPVAAGPWARAEAGFEIRVPSPRPWDAEHPNLYLLTVELRAGDRVLQAVEQRVGFRTTEIKGTSILINGRAVKLRGTCHHDSHPLLGRAVTPELTRTDLSLMKEANLNAVRTSHYPPIPELLDIADELGLYVEDEASFCWAGVAGDLAFTPRILQLTAELVARDRNHPSVFMWSLANESEAGFGFERSHEWVRSVDPSRPTGAATTANYEIATLHNPLAIRRIDEAEGLDRPLLFDESLCIFQGIFGDVAEMWTDPGVRDYYAAPLRAVYDRFMRSRVTRGSFIWCWADDIFAVPNRGLEYGRGVTRSHFLTEAYAVPGRGLTGDAPWGVVDGWRRPKPEFWITKKLHSPVRIAEAPVPMPAPGEPIRISVENQYDFTNLSDLRIGWELGGEKGEAAAEIPPQSSGLLSIRPGRELKKGGTLSLTFTDRSGRLVDAYKLALGEDVVAPPAYRGAAPAPLFVRREDRLAGIATHIVGRDFELSFDDASGLLRRGAAFGEPALLETPVLHVLPTANPRRPLPDPLGWKLSGMAVRREGENVRVAIRGSYPDFEGTYDLVVSPSGEINVEADFAYSGPDLYAREVGLRLSVPKSFGRLDWKRKAEWSVYPEDHIGRPEGRAFADAEHGADLPPSWPWARDASPMGSNDFRSSKRGLLWAALGRPEGPAVLVLSDGLQTARAMRETDRTSLHVSDWFGGTNAGWWEWELNYGKGRLLKKGDRIRSSVRLRLVRF